MARWTFSSSRCCLARRSCSAARARWLWRSPASRRSSVSPLPPALRAAEQSAFAEVDRRIDGYALPAAEDGERYVVVSTQSRGDEAALTAALATDAPYVAFVGSRLKAQTLKTALAARGVDGERLAALRAPAGLDLGAIGPEEIALSIMAEIVAFRRGRELRSPRP